MSTYLASCPRSSQARGGVGASSPQASMRPQQLAGCDQGTVGVCYNPCPAPVATLSRAGPEMPEAPPSPLAMHRQERAYCPWLPAGCHLVLPPNPGVLQKPHGLAAWNPPSVPRCCQCRCDAWRADRCGRGRCCAPQCRSAMDVLTAAAACPAARALRCVAAGKGRRASRSATRRARPQPPRRGAFRSHPGAGPARNFFPRGAPRLQALARVLVSYKRV